MSENLNSIIAIIVGIMSSIVVFYRIFALMIPMIKSGIKTHNISKIFSALSLLV